MANIIHKKTDIAAGDDEIFQKTSSFTYSADRVYRFVNKSDLLTVINSQINENQQVKENQMGSASVVDCETKTNTTSDKPKGNIPKISDKAIISATEAILSFNEWFPIYFQKCQHEYEGILNSDKLIVVDNADSLGLEMKLQFWRNILSVEKTATRITSNSMTLTSYQFFRDHNSKLYESIEQLKKNQQIVSKSFLRTVSNRRYAVINLYTSDQGMRLWFGGGKSWLPDQQQLNQSRFYTDDLFNQRYETFNSLIQLNKLNIEDEITDDSSARLRIVALYKHLMFFVHELLENELHYLAISRPELNFSGIIYRGETMQHSEFQTLLKTIGQDENDTFERCAFLFRVRSSTSNIKVSKKFLMSSSSSSSNDIKVLHKIHVIQPTDRQEVMQLLHRYRLDKRTKSSFCLDIHQYSYYWDEREVLSTNLPSMIVKMEEQPSGIWLVESVASPRLIPRWEDNLASLPPTDNGHVSLNYHDDEMRTIDNLQLNTFLRERAQQSEQIIVECVRYRYMLQFVRTEIGSQFLSGAECDLLIHGCDLEIGDAVEKLNGERSNGAQSIIYH